MWGGPLDPSAAKRALTRAVQLGITLIDTADAYGPEVNERFIAEALYPYPEGLVIATKGGLTPARGLEHERPAEHLRAACEGSLRRLRLERIDLYQLHAPDPRVPLEDSVGTLADMQAAGKIRHIGLSNVSIDELRRAQRIVPIVSVQNRYNFSHRASEDVLAVCEKEGIRFCPWPAATSPLAVRSLGSRTDNRATPVHGDRSAAARSPVMEPIPGTASVAHLEENAAARIFACRQRI